MQAEEVLQSRMKVLIYVRESSVSQTLPYTSDQMSQKARGKQPALAERPDIFDIDDYLCYGSSEGEDLDFEEGSTRAALQRRSSLAANYHEDPSFDTLSNSTGLENYTSGARVTGRGKSGGAIDAISISILEDLQDHRRFLREEGVMSEDDEPSDEFLSRLSIERPKSMSCFIWLCGVLTMYRCSCERGI